MYKTQYQNYISVIFLLFLIFFKGYSQKFFFSSDKDQLWLSTDLHIHSIFLMEVFGLQLE